MGVAAARAREQPRRRLVKVAPASPEVRALSHRNGYLLIGTQSNEIFEVNLDTIRAELMNQGAEPGKKAPPPALRPCLPRVRDADSKLARVAVETLHARTEKGLRPAFGFVKEGQDEKCWERCAHPFGGQSVSQSVKSVSTDQSMNVRMDGWMDGLVDDGVDEF